MTTESTQSGRDVGAVVHAIGILRFVAGSPGPHGVAAISRGTGVSPSTCFNILRTLARARFVAFDPSAKTYRLGLGLAELAAALIGTGQTDLIRPELERLALNYQVLIALWQVTDDRHIVLLDRAHGEMAVRLEMRPRLRLPMFVGAVGRAIAAALDVPGPELRRHFATLRWDNPPSFRDYERDVQIGRERGWSLDDGRLYRGIVSVAAAAIDGSRRPRLGVSGIAIAGQQTKETLSRLGDELRELVRLIEQALFGARNDVLHSE